MGTPKGKPNEKVRPKETARQEAFEEAGIIGTIVDRKISAKVNGKKIAFFPWKLKMNFRYGPNPIGVKENGFVLTRQETI